MTEAEIHTSTLELAKGRVAWAKAAPMADDATIAAAVERVKATSRALRKACRQLDHLLNHPWAVGNLCECSQEEIVEAYGNQAATHATTSLQRREDGTSAPGACV